MQPSWSELIAQVKRLSKELTRRQKRHGLVERYYEGSCPLPLAVRQARMTKAYRYLMPMAEASWGTLIVDSVLDRLEVTGITTGAKEIDKRLWEVWQSNQMDAESMLAHTNALIDGRVFAYSWPGEDSAADDPPEWTFDDSTQMIVQYAEGSHTRRVAAMRRWIDEDDGYPYATLYRREATYRFIGQKDYGWDDGIVWEMRHLPGDENWPVENPYDIVPVVELAVNRRLGPGSFGRARGEYEHCIGLLDRINLLTFLGLVVAVWMGFPLRGVIGDKILRDDDDKIIPPFDADADGVFQLENPEAKIAEFKAADRKNLSVYAELDQLAVITKSPRHYFPLEQGMTNISADAIRASEGGLHAKVNGKHKPFLGESWLDMFRISGKQLGSAIEVPATSQVQWADVESRSLAERADAFAKLTDLPWAARAELALNATADQIARWQADRASDPLSILASAAAAPPATAPMPAPLNGAGG